MDLFSKLTCKVLAAMMRLSVRNLGHYRTVRTVVRQLAYSSLAPQKEL